MPAAQPPAILSRKEAAMAFIQHRSGALLYHTAETLDAIPGVVHGFSTRLGGVSTGALASLNLRSAKVSGDQTGRVEENYRRFCAAVGAEVDRMVLSCQVHGDAVRVVTAADAGKGLFRPRDYEADALVTNEADLPLVVFSADCMVLLLCDPVAGCVGAVHAGWRGTALRIAEKTVETMTREFGARSEHIRAAIGAGIGLCCFETDGDVPEAMKRAMGAEATSFLHRRGEKWMVDLKGINRRQLELVGVPAAQIAVNELCTACHPELYWSHRKMGSVRGVQAAMIVWKGSV